MLQKGNPSWPVCLELTFKKNIWLAQQSKQVICKLVPQEKVLGLITLIVLNASQNRGGCHLFYVCDYYGLTRLCVSRDRGQCAQLKYIKTSHSLYSVIGILLQGIKCC